jgi:hypothetical protein
MNLRNRQTWPSILVSSLLSGFLLLQVPKPVGAQKNGSKLSELSQAIAKQRKKQIEEELKTLKAHPWAGKYYYGDGLGVNVSLALAPESGFVFQWHGCLGLYDLNYGAVLETDHEIRLAFKFPNERKGFEGIAPELLPITWGERHYLIPSDEVVGLTNAINAGFEPRNAPHGRFLLKRGDELRPANGQPNIPAQYAAYLLTKPINADIASVKETRVEDSRRIVTITLSAGSTQGVRENMEFHVYSPASAYESARVTVVNNLSSEAELVQYVDDKYSKRPSVGWRLSTHLRQE